MWYSFECRPMLLVFGMKLAMRTLSCMVDSILTITSSYLDNDHQAIDAYWLLNFAGALPGSQPIHPTEPVTKSPKSRGSYPSYWPQAPIRPKGVLWGINGVNSLTDLSCRCPVVMCKNGACDSLVPISLCIVDMPWYVSVSFAPVFEFHLIIQYVTITCMCSV